MPSAEQGKSKALCITTRCTSSDQFIEFFYRFCNAKTFFVATLNTRPVGLETQFSIQLADRTPVLRGLCVVRDVWTSPANPYKRPGIRLEIRRLTPDSEEVFAHLQARASMDRVPLDASESLMETPIPVPLPPKPPSAPIAPPPRSVRASTTVPTMTITVHAKAEAPPEPAAEQRTPGSELVLPANPLMNLTDESLEGFVDCTLYEETGSFFRDDFEKPVDDAEDPIASPPPPDLAPRPAIAVQAPVLLEDVAPQEPAPAARIETVPATPPPPPPVHPRAVPIVTAAPLITPFAPRAARRWWPIATTAIVGACIIAALIARFTGGTSAAVAAPEQTAAVATPEPAPIATEPKPSEPAVAPSPAPDPEPEPTEPDEPATTTGANGAPVVGSGPCTLAVSTVPAGTRIVVDGQAIGPSPISIAGPCTQRRVELVHPRYKRSSHVVTLEAGKPNALEITLIRPTHKLNVTTVPSGATVSIGGTRAGTSPTVVSLLGFSGIDVTVSKPGFAPITKRVYSKTANDKVTFVLKSNKPYKW